MTVIKGTKQVIERHKDLFEVVFVFNLISEFVFINATLRMMALTIL